MANTSANDHVQLSLMTSTQSGFNRSLGGKNVDTNKDVLINVSKVDREPLKSNITTARKPPSRSGNYYNVTVTGKSPGRLSNQNSVSISRYSTMSTKFGKHSTIDSFLKGT